MSSSHEKTVLVCVSLPQSVKTLCKKAEMIQKAIFLIYNWIKTTCQDEKIIQVLEDNENQLNQV